MLELVKELCGLPGVSSFEEPVRAFIRARAEPFADELRTDVMGNLIVFKRGKKATGKKLMLCAHMDEVGLIVKQITDGGYLKFSTVGGIDPRILLGKRVLVGERGIPGVVGLKAYHLVSAEEEKTVPKLSEFYLDIGAKDKEAAEALAAPGDCAVFDSDIVEFGSGLIKAKALDNRVGCAVMLKLLEEELPLDCTFVFAAQEEVGNRGAFASTFSVEPNIALVLETTTAADLAGAPGHKQVCALSKGPVVSYMDCGSVADRRLYELLRELAVTNSIPWQTKHYLSGGNDAAAIQRTKAGVRTVVMSAAVRYLHTPSSVAAVRDLEQMLALSRLFLAAIAEQQPSGI